MRAFKQWGSILNINQEKDITVTFAITFTSVFSVLASSSSSNFPSKVANITNKNFVTGLSDPAETAHSIRWYACGK
ncbi:gp53-like domain-containing protein [Megamonas hypermegale]|uniref:gp53-like domain-containing protein n=1 Tax=Megamonas hypermegale TaxID=158847 RepID=UPI003BEEFBE5